MTVRPTSQIRPISSRRVAVGVLSVLFLSAYVVIYSSGGSRGSTRAGMEICGRLGLMLAALWLAWPSLRRPASWLPPGIAILGIGMMAVVAVRPRLIVMALPALGVMTAVTAAMRMFHRPHG